MNRGIALVNTSTYERNGKTTTAYKITGRYFGDTLNFLKNLETHIDQIPTADRVNLFYTIAEQGEPDGNKRVFHRQYILPFDLDGIDKEKLDEYQALFALTLNIDLDKIMVICSGNGLHFLIAQVTPITDRNYFQEMKYLYNGVCSHLNRELAKSNLPGQFDTAIWEPSRILRMPFTTNRKKGKEDTRCYVVRGDIEPLDINLEKLSPKLVLKPSHFIKTTNKKLPFPTVDVNAMVEKDGFLRWCADNPEKVNEVQWYCMICLLIYGRGGHEKIHELSKGHPDYDASDTDDKIAQAIENSPGPHTYEYVMSIWDGDDYDCPMQGGARSPIFWQGEDFIPTLETGFRKLSSKGMPTKQLDVASLVKYFGQKYIYVNTNEGLYVYKDNHYERPKDRMFLQRFARKHVHECRDMDVREFKNSVLESPTKFIYDIDSKKKECADYINLQNGVLNLKTMEMEDHNPDKFFTYILPYGYDPSAECPTFEYFLDSVTRGDKQLMKLVRQIFAYCLSNMHPSKMEKFFLFYGPGGNGKSRAKMVLEKLMGKDNVSNVSLKNIGKENSIIQAQDTKANISSESPKSFRDGETLKKLVSGEEVEMRYYYSDQFMASVNAKFIFMANEMPRTSDVTEGLYRRMVIVPFNANFYNGKEAAQADKNIEDKMYKELSGIFNLIIKELIELKQTEKFVEPTVCLDAMERYKKDNDSVAGFIDEYDIKAVSDSERYVVVSELAYEYKKYCEDYNCQAVGRSKFKERFANQLSLSKNSFDRIRIGEKRPHIIRNVEMHSIV